MRRFERGSSPFIGSSKAMTWGFNISTLARATQRFSPSLG